MSALPDPLPADGDPRHDFPEAGGAGGRPSRDDLVEVSRRVTRRGQLRRRRARRRLVVALVLIAAVAAAGAVLLVPRTPDRFAGVWWEPSSGRRVELVADGDGYRLLYGTAKQAYAARLQDGRLVVASPLGGDIVLRRKGDDRLVLEEGGKKSVLRRLPDGL